MDSEDRERKARKGCQETCSGVYTMNLRKVTPYWRYSQQKQKPKHVHVKRNKITRTTSADSFLFIICGSNRGYTQIMYYWIRNMGVGCEAMFDYKIHLHLIIAANYQN